MPASRRGCVSPVGVGSVATYNQWKSQYAGMEVPDMKRVKRMYAELSLDNAATEDQTRKKL